MAGFEYLSQTGSTILVAVKFIILVAVKFRQLVETNNKCNNEQENIFHPTDHAREMSYRGRDAAIVKDWWRKHSGP